MRILSVSLITHRELKFMYVHDMVGSTGTPSVSLNLYTRWRLVVNFTPQPLYLRKMADTHLKGDRIHP